MNASSTSPEKTTPTEGRFLLNALVAAVAGVVLGFVPLSPALGGAIGGYLQGGDAWNGTKVGLVGGLVAAIPALALALLFGLFAIAGGPGARAGLAFGTFVLLAFLFAAVYVVGLSALGGWAGGKYHERRFGSRADSDDASAANAGVERSQGPGA